MTFKRIIPHFTTIGKKLQTQFAKEKKLKKFTRKHDEAIS
jgi:hypothetical protein